MSDLPASRLRDNPTAAFLLGQEGTWRVTSTTVISGKDIIAIECHNDTMFSTLTEGNKSGDVITAVTIPAGTVLYGQFSAFTVSTGSPSILVSAYTA